MDMPISSWTQARKRHAVQVRCRAFGGSRGDCSAPNLRLALRNQVPGDPQSAQRRSWQAFAPANIIGQSDRPLDALRPFLTSLFTSFPSSDRR